MVLCLKALVVCVTDRLQFLLQAPRRSRDVGRRLDRMIRRRMEHLRQLLWVLCARLQLVRPLPLDNVLNLVEEVLVVSFYGFSSLTLEMLRAQVRLVDQVTSLEGVHGA